jgi:hypothetical protein
MGMRRDGQGWLLYGEIRGIREGREMPKRGLEPRRDTHSLPHYQLFTDESRNMCAEF